jgi:formylmethanofuran dehydrogenase subunit B
MSEVKPCPFCGSECELQEIQYAFDLKQYAKHPYNDCILGSFRLVPISLWQSRPIEDALQKRIDDLEAENKALKLIANSHSMSELRRLQAQTGWRKYPPAEEVKHE